MDINETRGPNTVGRAKDASMVKIVARVSGNVNDVKSLRLRVLLG